MPECDHRGQLHHVGQPTRLRVCGQYRRRTEGSARRPQPETFAQARQIRQPVAHRRNVQSDWVIFQKRKKMKCGFTYGSIDYFYCG